MIGIPEINYAGVVLAAVGSMVVGFVWYAPAVFGNAWMRLAKVDPNSASKDQMMKAMGGSFVASLVTAWVLSNVVMLIGATLLFASAFVGLLAGIGFVATTSLTNTLYSQQPMKLYFINAGYHVVNLTVMGLVIGYFV